MDPANLTRKASHDLSAGYDRRRTHPRLPSAHSAWGCAEFRCNLTQRLTRQTTPFKDHLPEAIPVGGVKLLGCPEKLLKVHSRILLGR